MADFIVCVCSAKNKKTPPDKHFLLPPLFTPGLSRRCTVFSPAWRWYLRSRYMLVKGCSNLKWSMDKRNKGNKGNPKWSMDKRNKGSPKWSMDKRNKDSLKWSMEKHNKHNKCNKDSLKWSMDKRNKCNKDSLK